VKQQTYTLRTINSQLVKELVRADKGKTCVITYNDDYNNKIHNFLTKNNFQKLQKNPTNKSQQCSTEALQQSDLIVHKNQIKHLIQKKPRPPPLKAQIKIHKPDNPIRPVVNNVSASAYKIPKFMANKLNDYLNLKYQYNTKDSTTLANDLTKLKIHGNYRMITFDIMDLYVNIPIKETLGIMKSPLLEHNNEHITKQIISLRRYHSSTELSHVRGQNISTTFTKLTSQPHITGKEHSFLYKIRR
jgi:hypothetical protein